MGSRAQMALSSGQIAPKMPQRAKIGQTCQSRIGGNGTLRMDATVPDPPQSQDFQAFPDPGQAQYLLLSGNFRSSGHLRRPQTFHPGAGQDKWAARRKPAASPLAGCGGILLLCAEPRLQALAACFQAVNQPGDAKN